MKWDEDILEENYVFVPKRNCKSTNDTCKNIKKFSGTIEFMGLMDESKETLVDGLSNHLPSWY